jgi:hypothetical protein
MRASKWRGKGRSGTGDGNLPVGVVGAGALWKHPGRGL